jgi:hypothetical protein
LNPLGIHTKALSPLYSLLSSLADLSESVASTFQDIPASLAKKTWSITPFLSVFNQKLCPTLLNKISFISFLCIIGMGKRLDWIKV